MITVPLPPATVVGPAESLRAGTRVGQHTVEMFIGSGGFGSIYSGVSDCGKPVAIKVLHPELRGQGDSMTRFVREASVLERLDHPNVVDLYDSGLLPDGRAYYVMELLVGQDLEVHIEQHGQIGMRRALDLLEPICDALSAAHAHGIIHRDIKASNVFLDESRGDSRVVLLDFGIAKLTEAGDKQLTSSRMALGTPTCMAPEQIRGATVDSRADVYALGGLAFRMLSGRKPFCGENAAILHYMQLHGSRPSLGEANLGPTIDAIIAKAMAIEPDDRHATVDEFLASLRAADEQVRARRANRRLSRQSQRDAVGVYIDVRDRTAGVESNDATLDAIDDILENAAEFFTHRDFHTAFESGTAILLAKLLPDTEDDQSEQVESTIAAAGQLHDRLANHLQPGLSVNVCVHRDGVMMSADTIRGGDLLRLDRWTPDPDVDRACFTEQAISGLELDTEPVPGIDGLHRLAPPPQTPQTDRKRELHEQMMAQIGRQAASVVHDLRSPLTCIVANLGWLMSTMEGELSEDQCDSLQDSIDAATQLKELASHLLQSSSVEAYSTERSLVSVSDAVDRALRLTRTETAMKANVHVFHEGDSHFLGSAGRFTLVLTNLLANAAAAIEEFGDIYVRTQVTPDGLVQIAVRDTGSGIAPAQQDQIFDPFFTTKPLAEGTGLGLATVREIVEEHGGSVSVDSSPGAGTCFTIRIPSAAVEPVQVN